MIQEFQGDKDSGAEEEFFGWLAAHPKGFVVNCASSGWKLHRAKCANLRPDDAWVCMTRNRKVCSEDQEELARWAAKERRSYSRCANCPPYNWGPVLESVIAVGVLLIGVWWESRRRFRK